MMKLAMATLNADLKSTVGLEQGDQVLDFHAGILPWALGCGLTYQVNRRAAPTLTSKKTRTGPSG